MLKKSILLLLLLLWNHYGLGIPYSELYHGLVEFCTDRRLLLLTITLLTGGALLATAYLFTDCGLYKIAKALSVLAENLALFLLLTLGVAQALFYHLLAANLYAATGYLPLFLLFALLLAALQAQRVIDFNHPVRQALVPAAIAAAWPLVFMALYALLG